MNPVDKEFDDINSPTSDFSQSFLKMPAEISILKYNFFFLLYNCFYRNFIVMNSNIPEQKIKKCLTYEEQTDCINTDLNDIGCEMTVK